MSWETIMTALQTVSIIAAILVAVGTLRSRSSQRIEELAEMRADLRYIKAKVEDMPQMRERLTIVEHETTRAHERIDDIRRDLNHHIEEAGK